MARELSKLYVVLGIDDKALQKGLTNIDRNLKPLGLSLNKLTIAAGAMGAAMLGMMAASVKSFVKSGDEIQKLAWKTNFSVESLSAMKYAAALTGNSLSDLDSALSTMSKHLGDAQRGMTSAAAPFWSLGLAIADLKTKTPEEQLKVIIDALSKITDPALKKSIAEDIFGGAADEMLRAAETYKANKEFIDKLADPEAMKSAVELAASFSKLGQSIQGLSDQIGKALAPVLKPVVDLITDIITNLVVWAKENPELFATITKVVSVISGLVTGVATVLMGLGGLKLAVGAATAGFALLSNPVGQVIAIIILLAFWIAVIIANWDTIKEKAVEIGIGIFNFFKGLLSNWINFALGYYNTFIDIINNATAFLSKIPGVKIGIIPHIELPDAMKGALAPTAMPDASTSTGAGGGFGDIYNITVQGTVQTERSLADVMREIFLDIQRRNTSTGFA
jgi:hypothetical protein